MINIKKQKDEIIRLVFVATEDLETTDIMDIARFVDESTEIEELSFRQMINDKYEAEYYNHEFLLWGHKKGLWHYIEQNDYNTYYVEGKMYNKYSDIG